MQFFKKYKKIERSAISAYSIENIQLLRKSIQYRTYSYKFIYRIFVYLSYIFHWLSYVSLYTIYRIRYTIYDIFVYRIHYSSVYNPSSQICCMDNVISIDIHNCKSTNVHQLCLAALLRSLWLQRQIINLLQLYNSTN